ncbi:hypothetical protein MSG28_015248 [Choristoneura fumiferana]|uniref:Uncharacterized protein n=1 Tax=Choristoneura fumiferana TaxID=7141 RepID=A0ACC0KZ27_CHOFU|nr:hypothetical protein MSG28_015248 [Choristoneura fumiferana]
MHDVRECVCHRYAMNHIDLFFFTYLPILGPLSCFYVKHRSKKRKHKHSAALRSRLTPPSEPERSEESPLLLAKRPDAPDTSDASDAPGLVRRASDESDDDYWNAGTGPSKARNSSHAHPTRTHEDSDPHDAPDAHDTHDAHDEREGHDGHDGHDGHEPHAAPDAASPEHAAPQTHEPHTSDPKHDARFRVVSADARSGEFRDVPPQRSRVLAARAQLAHAASGRGRGTTGGGEDTETTGSAHDAGAPVQLVMRSNLTFNLGDELFTWRRDNPDELVIPAPEARPPDSSASDSSAAD